jgi:hypothetical protein
VLQLPVPGCTPPLDPPHPTPHHTTPTPTQEWNRENDHDAEAFFGVEDVFKRDPLAPGAAGWGVTSGRFGVQFEQWALASAPGHPVYCDMARLIRWAFGRGLGRGACLRV